MIHIDKDTCKGCGICIAVCPKSVLEFSKELNQKGVNYPEVVNEKKCILCENCMIYCPDFAVVVKKDGKK
ncbi:MAG: 4Fe-4S binding protein [Candidatus Atribacteria bacterium]|mgnify:CR=1 FL=1|jgi:2-oxoglutarate ferredoxin oxidoreductase subunit delta|nr:4Fe-4S binding protein [Candidatus Atribacteria bacterium]